MKISEFIKELYLVYNRVMSAFIANFKYNPIRKYRDLVYTLNCYQTSIDDKVGVKDSELFVTQFPEIVNEFNEMIDWITALNSGFQDVAKYRIKI